MGTSIGVPGERGGGTLGPFVTLENNGNMLNGVLSNYHVVCPPEGASHDTKQGLIDLALSSMHPMTPTLMSSSSQ